MVHRIIGWLIVILLVALPIYYLVSREEVIEVTTMTLTRGHVEQTASCLTSGTVMPEQDSLIASGTMGTVLDVCFKEGNRVQIGDILVELDHSVTDAQVTLANANLKVGKSKLESARLASGINDKVAQIKVEQTEEQLDLAQKNFDRIRELHDKGGISKAELDKASEALNTGRKSYEAALTMMRQSQVYAENIRSLEASIEQLEAAVEAAVAICNKAYIRAPFPGVVAKTIVDVGEAVAIGMPLVQLVQDDKRHVRAPFDEAHMSVIKMGQKARLNIDAYRNIDFMGRVNYMSPVISINPDLSRTLDVEIEVEDGSDKFVAGSSVDVLILVDEKEDVLFVPSETLIREQFAYVVENGHAVKRTVELGVGNWRHKEVLAGLELGEILVTSINLKGLRDGVKVKVVDKLEEQ